ncbi:unnamed protein product, partial [Ixodes pacificus]
LKSKAKPDVGGFFAFFEQQGTKSLLWSEIARTLEHDRNVKSTPVDTSNALTATKITKMALPRGWNAVSLLYALRSTAFSRSLRTTAAVGVKEIRERQEDGVTIYEGINVDSPRKGLVVKPRHNTTACPLCRVGLTNLKYTDVLILSQFVDSKGNQLPTSVTGLCRKQHKLVGRLVYEAQRTGECS